ncbi:MAG: hypothetical protein JO037_12655 [Actinobacteria bacterium]|nr:hypothetical protein [Actinomycetota bacterium]
MLRLWDDRAGSYARLAARPSVPLRVCVHGPAARPGPSHLRALLVADVLTRVAELRGGQVITVLAADGPPDETLGRDISALGIHPPAARTSPEEIAAVLGGPAHVHVAWAGPGDHRDGLLLDVGPVEGEAGGPAGNGPDPLALRLALLSRSYRQPVTLTRAVLADAAGVLDQWRARVAGWAGEPSRPIPPDIAGKIRDAFDDDLDTAAALALLREVESDPGMPAGAKFETFVFVDRVLGLELPREIGRR